MIPTILQDVLVDELKALFAGYKLKDVNGQDAGLNIYPQFLPAKKHRDDDDHFPYIVVRLQDGEDPEETEPNTCRILLIVGVVDEGEGYQGYKDVLNILGRIYQHLFRKRTLANRFRVEYPVRWSLPEEDSYPFYFGGLETNWVVGKVVQEEDDLV